MSEQNNEILRYQRGHAWLYPEHPFNFNGFINIPNEFSERDVPYITSSSLSDNRIFRSNTVNENWIRLLWPKVTRINDDVNRTSTIITRNKNETISQTNILKFSHEGIVVPVNFSTTDGNGKTTTNKGPSSVREFRVFCSLWDSIQHTGSGNFTLTYNGITFTIHIVGVYVGGRSGKWGRSKTRRLRGYRIRCTTSDPFWSTSKIATMYQRNNHPENCFNIYNGTGVPCNGQWYDLAGHDLYAAPLLIIQNRPTW